MDRLKNILINIDLEKSYERLTQRERKIIKLVTERKKKISEVAKDIGVTSTSIRRWITQYSEYGKDAFPGKGNLRAEDDKIRKLMRDNIDLKEENEILKKAMAI